MATTTPAILRAVPLALILTVPTDSDPLDIAQEAADAVRELHREQSGERYAASAEFAVPDTQPDEFEAIVSGARVQTGHQLLFLAGLLWACRDWDPEGVESAAAMVDARHAVARLCAQRWPQADPPFGLPVDLRTVQLAALPGRTARTVVPAAEVVPPFSLN